MAATRPEVLVRYIRGLAVRSGDVEVPDRELLRRFATHRDEAAFAILVRRHGPMVQGVCRRLLHESGAAEDAFQATFLVLSKKAASLRTHESLANWLYSVARRTALKARISAVRRQRRERQAFTPSSPDPLAEVSLREALAVLDEELARLPERYRAPLVLCCLEGQARDEAAQRLGWPVKLLKSRLEQARELLRKRLTRRGLTLSAGLFAVLLSESAVEAAVPAGLVAAATRQALTGGASATVTALAKGALNMMLWQELRTTVVLLAMGVLAGTVAVLAWEPAQARVSRDDLARHAAVQTANGAKDSDVGKTELERLQGTWLIKEEESGGQRRPSKDWKWTIKGTRLKHFRVDLPSRAYWAFDFEIDPKANLKRIDLTYASSPRKGEKLPGIYVLKGDELIVCYAWLPEGQPKPRPTDFETKPDSGLRLFVLQKENPAPAEKPGGAGRIYLHVGGGGFHSLDPDGTAEKEVISTTLAAGPHYQLHSARLSPDGTRLAFGLAGVVGNVAGPPSQLRVLEIAFPREGEVLADMEEAELHRWAWSPDGKKLAVTSWDAKNRSRNWIVDVQTKKLEEIKLPIVKDEKHGDYQMVICDWSPNGQHFLALGNAVHLLKTDGTIVRRLTGDVRVFDGRCRFCPDGRKVLYVTWNKDGSHSLFVVDTAGGEPKALVEAANFMDMNAVWAPDGKKIAYLATLMEAGGKRGQETTLFVIDADGKNTVTLRTEKHDEHELKMVLTDWR